MSDHELDQQLAAISVVKSAELMELATDSRDLNNISNQVLSSVNKVMEVKSILENTPDHELTPETVNETDSMLSSLNVITIDEGEVVYNEHRVAGAEAFGFTLRPSTYKQTRIDACESFLSGAVDTVKVFTKRLVQNFHDAYTLTIEDTESLIQRFKMIERASRELGEFKDGLERFNLSSRLMNLLKVNGSVKEDWSNQILNLYKTTSALTTNYYDYSDKELTMIMAYFSRFESVTTNEDAVALLMQSGTILNTQPFRECKIDISDKQTPWLRKLRSVELMGGRYLIDTRFKDPIKVRDVKTIDDWFDSRIKDIGVRLNKRDSIEVTDVEQEIDTFGSNTIKHVCQLSIKILESWLQICNRASKHRVSDRDYEEIGNMLNSLTIDDIDKHRLMAMYSMSVRKNQQDLVNVNTDFTRYLVITLNAIASLCNDSINYAKSV